MSQHKDTADHKEFDQYYAADTVGLTSVGASGL